VVEDAAQGIGAKWKGEAAGTFGDLSVLSFGRGKGWTGGSGGAVMARNGFEMALPVSLPGHKGSRASEASRSLAVWLLARPSLYGIPARIPALGLGETRYRSPTEPTAITAFAATMVLAGRERSLREVEVRRGNAEVLRGRLKAGGGDVLIPEPLPEGESGYLRFPVLSASGRLVAERRGVYRSYPRALAELEVLAPLIRQHVLLPGASRLAGETVTYPVHSRVG
jgi:dTDP-4-amino-4,6-dideoxygalactose transaminase